jgi:hypothetical protein
MLITAGLHALCRAFEAPKFPAASPPQDWQYAVSDWVASIVCAPVVEVEGGGRQIAVVVAAAKERCRVWKEKVGGEGRRSSRGALESGGGGTGSSSGSSGGSSGSSSSSSGGSSSSSSSSSCGGGINACVNNHKH